MLATSAVAVRAHTDAVGFQISPGTVAGQFDVDFFYGSWHSGAESTVPEGGLALWSLTDAEALLYEADPVANANIGTQIIGDSLDGIDDPTGTNDSVGFSISPLFSSTTNYQNASLLPAGFTAGVNYFYAASDPSTGDEALIGSAGFDYTAGPWTDPSTGITYDTSSVWGNQVASAMGLLPGTYRFYYDALDTPSSVTWEPEAPIRYMSFTILADGSLSVPGAAGGGFA